MGTAGQVNFRIQNLGEMFLVLGATVQRLVEATQAAFKRVQLIKTRRHTNTHILIAITGDLTQPGCYQV